VYNSFISERGPKNLIYDDPAEENESQRPVFCFTQVWGKTRVYTRVTRAATENSEEFEILPCVYTETYRAVLEYCST
jgi:hypothetical protein